MLRISILAFALFVGPVNAQRTDFPTGCPSLPKQKAVVKKDAPKTPEQAEADKLVAEGRAATRTFSGENVAKAISLFEQAVGADPTNAQAYIALARAHTQSQRYMSVPKKIARARAWENLSKGRELDPANIDGLYMLADQILANDHDYKCAKRILETALRLDPRNARSNHYYSQLLSGMGKFDLAFQYADKAIALADADTRSFVLTNSGRPRYMAGQYDWVLTKYLESTPNAPLAHFYRSLAYGAKGMFTEALDEAKKYQAGDRARDAGGVGMIALAYANAGQKEKARELLSELLQRDARGEHVVEYRIAAVYEVLGERDEAFHWLDKQIDDSDGLGSWLVWLNHDPVWKEMRKDRRWKGIQKRAGWKD
ncbi:MAG: tetratricopeptide repeat protein [Blastocatellia bacterium]